MVTICTTAFHQGRVEPTERARPPQCPALQHRDGTLLCAAQLLSVPDPLEANSLIGINSINRLYSAKQSAVPGNDSMTGECRWKRPLARRPWVDVEILRLLCHRARGLLGLSWARVRCSWPPSCKGDRCP